MSMRVILSVFVIAGLLVGCGGAAGTPAADVSASPSMSGAIGGSVTFQMDGAPATTEVEAVADVASLSGTAVTTFSKGTHTVQVECAAKDDGGWVLGGTVETTTV